MYLGWYTIALAEDFNQVLNKNDWLISLSLLNFLAEDAWCTRKPNSEEEKRNQYIQVDFLLKTRVTSVGTMRRKNKDHWVYEYYLKYSDDDVNWVEYQENGHARVSDNHQTIGLL